MPEEKQYDIRKRYDWFSVQIFGAEHDDRFEEDISSLEVRFHLTHLDMEDLTDRLVRFCGETGIGLERWFSKESIGGTYRDTKYLTQDGILVLTEFDESSVSGAKSLVNVCAQEPSMPEAIEKAKEMYSRFIAFIQSLGYDTSEIDQYIAGLDMAELSKYLCGTIADGVGDEHLDPSLRGMDRNKLVSSPGALAAGKEARNRMQAARRREAERN